MLDFLKKQWNLLSEASAWILSTIGGFWRQPSATIPQDSTRLESFGQFFLTLAVGLLVIPANRYRRKKHTRGWVLVALGLIVLIPVVYFVQDWYVTSWTCGYAGERVIVGSNSDLTEHGKKYVADHPNDTCDQIVWDHAGKVEDVWAREAIDSRRRVLAILYIAFLPLMAGGMISVIQASYCGTR